MLRSLDRHLFGPGPKRILSLDGGGVRGMITLGLLKKVETELRKKFTDECRIRDYFDLIGGTSTGALVATLLALGYDVDRIEKLYRKLAPEVFSQRRLLQGIYSRFDTDAFERAIRATLGEYLAGVGRNPKDVDGIRMKSELLGTGLALVTKRIDTGSVWVLTNNSKAKYWSNDSELWRQHHEARDSGKFYPNSDYQLAKLVQASASAPFYLDGVEIEIEPDTFGHFLDGGASPFNNPSQELFLMATLKSFGRSWSTEDVSPFGFNWKTGAGNLMMLSLGTGIWRHKIDAKAFGSKWAASKAAHALMGIMHDAAKHSEIWMQAISEPRHSHEIDGNLLDLRDLRIVQEPLLQYRRINPRLERDWLEKELGADFAFPPKTLERTRELDNPDTANLDRLHRIGLALGEKSIAAEDLPNDKEMASHEARS